MLLNYPTHLDAVADWSGTGALANRIKWLLFVPLIVIIVFGIYSFVKTWWAKRGNRGGEKEKEEKEDKKKED